MLAKPTNRNPNPGTNKYAVYSVFDGFNVRIPSLYTTTVCGYQFARPRTKALSTLHTIQRDRAE